MMLAAPRLPASSRALRLGVALLAMAFVVLYALLGEAKPPADWRLIDIAGEGGTALAALGWMWIVIGSRPAGRVTLWLSLGLAAVALGAWADCLDELFSTQSMALRIDKWLESGLTPLGMLLLTVGLVGWRREQFQLSEHMARRERLFREHRAFDRITDLASADYLCEQVAAERRERPGRPVALAMVEIVGLQTLLHEQGRGEALRAMQAVTHQLLLNLRNDDLLCRYAGDRFVVLLPGSSLAEAQHRAAHLVRMVRLMSFHGANGERRDLALRTACALAGDDARHSLTGLSRELEDWPQAATALSTV